MSKKKVPELRFKGFTEDWEQRKVKSISEKTYGGGTPKTKMTEYWQGDFPWIQSSDLKVGELNEVKPQKFITEEALKNSAAKAIPKNSIAIVTRVGVGKLAYLKYPYSTSQDFLSLSVLTVDPLFGVYGLYKLIKKELNNIQGTSIKGMTKSDLLNKKLYIPFTLEEQKQIGTFLKTLDNTIALHQEKLEKLKQLKKGYLQVMFPQKGEKVPQLRFANFSQDWKQRNLNELMDFSNGINAPKENYGSGRKMISVMDILSTDHLVYENILNSVNVSKQTEEKNKVEFGDMIFVRSSEIIEEVGWAKAYLDENYALYSGFSIRGKRKEKYDPIFVEHSLNGISRKQIERKAGGSTRFNVSQEVLNSLLIQTPSFEEQIKIGTFLKELDTTTFLQKKKISILKNIKQELLKKIFI
ncbi:restriction endonuclease subunit S [Desemzia incerta]|uniref:restriction endonuclease subunit S n=1 Tax=Desemzia incerta TaxID=82801 RepID=UPI003D05C67F